MGLSELADSALTDFIGWCDERGMEYTPEAIRQYAGFNQLSGHATEALVAALEDYNRRNAAAA